MTTTTPPTPRKSGGSGHRSDAKNRTPRTSATQPTNAATSGYRTVLGRLPILELSPSVDGGLWPAKAYAGEVVPFSAVAFREGHGVIGVDLTLVSPDGARFERRMRPGAPGTDRWHTLAQVPTEGMWRFRVTAWADDWATWLHAAEVKVPLGQDVELVFAEGAQLLTRALAGRRPPSDRVALRELVELMGDTSADPAARLDAATAPRVTGILTARPIASLVTHSAEHLLEVERTEAGVASWYEFFPRSEGAKRLADGTWKSGTFRSAARRLPAVAAMGFDVVYLPPVHPIGESYRKGRNNSLAPEPGDPGSPWAIGGDAGGHDVLHPDLGDTAEFIRFVRKAAKLGLEVAMDFALQASPDHPWVREHPEWFTTLPDGSIAYAENPPKKYQDIYPINFDNDPDGIRAEALRLIEYWIAAGIRTFRVDNPHTKPLDFWEWLIHTVRLKHPDIVFLAEAFTRPAVMQTLAKAGFQQSYSYFTWRNSKEELEEFLDSIAHETDAFLRPNLFVNTPDILTEYLQFGGHPAFKLRAAIAATGAPLWGVYSGFELYESVARSGAEEYIDNEKYEYRPRDYAQAEARGESLAPYLTMLNRVRDEHPALRQLRNLTVHASDDDAVLVFSKHLEREFTGTRTPDTVIVVANVDPHSVRETLVHLDLAAIGLPVDARFEVTDAVTGQTWTWGSVNYVRLDAFDEPVHILSVKAV
ncbi:alpha-1,4-glucan--maltose-1-phosphate maltosyltransferase [Humibacter ginsenosidimutans]|uniref:alpha-1,4-glucan--maltose-1-phosphate maltosyltransferase n=1 Tax=Humibacter ginsenosidimutans TaxID=2599293 RepID=UPI003F5D1D93